MLEPKIISVPSMLEIWVWSIETLSLGVKAKVFGFIIKKLANRPQNIPAQIFCIEFLDDTRKISGKRFVMIGIVI